MMEVGRGVEGVTRDLAPEVLGPEVLELGPGVLELGPDEDLGPKVLGPGPSTISSLSEPLPSVETLVLLLLNSFVN